jgi:DNA-binding HxlR family transcriptional regulator
MIQPMSTSAVLRRRRSGCPISIALELLGDAWSLLIVRDLMFKDRRTYNDFLTGGEGIASNVLADRLRKLEAANIIEKRRDPEDARRFLYRLSPKGIELAPVLVELVIWSATSRADRRASCRSCAACARTRRGIPRGRPATVAR